MANSPTDTSKQFIESGMRLITSPSADALLKKSKELRERVRKAVDGR